MDIAGFYARTVFPRLCDWFLDRPIVARRRRELLAQSFGDVLEIGFGTGLNLPHYPPSVRRLTTVDPNVSMHALAKRRLRRVRFPVEHRAMSGEQLPFSDGLFDCVVSTFTLCSIEKVDQAMREAFRVLKPGGRFLFLEHGLSPDRIVATWQRRLNWLEMRLADGCRLNRDMRAIVAGLPFADLRIEQFYLSGIPKTHGFMSQGMAEK